MSTFSSQELRIIDANLNRLKEGIRVAEDIFRYAFDNKEIASALKSIRHLAKLPTLYTQLLQSRNSENDVLKPSTPSEMNRTDMQSTVIANFKRAQEAARVLEEILKRLDSTSAQSFKDARYTLYTIEKTAFTYLEDINNTSNSK